MTPEIIKDNPHVLVGSKFLCPHCNTILEVIKVNACINAAYDPSGSWNDFILIQFEDGEWSRFWLNEYPDLPRLLRDL